MSCDCVKMAGRKNSTPLLYVRLPVVTELSGSISREPARDLTRLNTRWKVSIRGLCVRPVQGSELSSKSEVGDDEVDRSSHGRWSTLAGTSPSVSLSLGEEGTSCVGPENKYEGVPRWR
jgi:hypothetical protein